MSTAKRAGVFAPTDSTLEDWLDARGEPRFRSAQIRQWIAQRRAVAFEPMSNLPKGLREALTADWNVFASRISKESADDDGTTKLLLELVDGQTVECVLIPEEKRRTICLSTQVGCGMGCVFCASGLGGVIRNLTSGEMIEELLQLQAKLPDEERINHVVVMGMGEPLANLEALTEALTFATSAPGGLGISARNITISSVGLPAKIRRLADMGKQYHLALSLHAPNNDLRQHIVPMAEKVALEDILAAADYFREKTRRQVTFEYVLLGGVNDRPEHAHQLGRLLTGRDSLINLIPYNPVEGLGYRTPEAGRSREFAEILRNAGYVVKIRKRKGSSINAACGQLRRVHQQTVPIKIDAS